MNILLHMCCANCAIYPVRVLREKNMHVTGLFYNNNIHPYQEFRKRLDTAREYASRVELELIVNEEYQLDQFLQQVAADPKKRCSFCYRSRLEETARITAENGFDAFSTTLLYSRYQQHERIREFGESLALKYDVTFHYEDFRTGWQEGIQVSKSMGLYRQQYCGCIYSERDRYSPRSRN
ncbi:epoxyqueuosine reductase QueH [Malonomonas rubra]|uniref:epoxyqueuosine reductase QueH n=1 Tax=Malonomonas rubra TaxID=57040 RepID=UPI0026EB021B|nr:epoxyqueuosine reductase QueH [Malonomonas rubra]